MKRTTLAALFLALALPTASALAQKSGAKMGGDDALKADLVAMERKAWEAWKNKNADFFRTYLSDDAINNGREGVETKDQIVRGVATDDCEVRSYSFDEGSFALRRIDADAAILTYKANQDYTCNGRVGPTPVWVSTVYVKRRGKWLNMLYQETQAGQ
jgi:hypothetical protein